MYHLFIVIQHSFLKIRYDEIQSLFRFHRNSSSCPLYYHKTYQYPIPRLRVTYFTESVSFNVIVCLETPWSLRLTVSVLLGNGKLEHELALILARNSFNLM